MHWKTNTDSTFRDINDTQAASSQALCLAFSDIQKKLIEHSKIIPSLTHVETPKEKKKRLKQSGKPKKKKVTT